MSKWVLPYSVVSRYRTARYRARPRTNFDVVVASTSDQKRWLANTPDTYRVGLLTSLSDDLSEDPVEDTECAVGVTDLPTGLRDVAVAGEWDAHQLKAAERVFGDPSVDAVVVARTAFRRTAWIVEEPSIEPLGVAVRQSALTHIGGNGHPSSPGVLYRRLRDAGYRFALLPHPGEGEPHTPMRTDTVGSPSVVVLSLVPLHDVGGGGRSARIAIELVRRGYHVTFVSAHRSVGADLGLRYIHPNLEQRWVWDFDPGELIGRVAPHDRVLVLVEAPAREMVRNVAPLMAAGYRAVYDIIDDWSDHALGWDWYDKAVEDRLMRSVDAVTVSAPGLVPDTPGGALVVPNGVDATVFSVHSTAVPDDLPLGEGPTIGYHGSLYGAWLDWSAVEAVALAYPQGKVVMIGDDGGVARDLPRNVHFLGPKALGDLPAYVQRFDVGLVPFTVSEATHAVSPLKVYEYLASGVPVAGSPLRALDGIAGVYTNTDLVTAVAAALDASKPDRAAALVEHSWSERLGRMFQQAGVALRDLDTHTDVGDVAVVRRPVAHYGKDERIVDL